MQALNWLPPVELRKRFKALALADAVLSPEWEYRYFSFNAIWNAGEEMASMRDDEGNEYFFWFPAEGGCFKVYTKGSSLDGEAQKQLVQVVAATAPHRVQTFFTEPAFSIQNSTALGWFDTEKGLWQAEGDLDSAAEVLKLVLSGHPRDYQEWAEDYYETEVDLAALRRLFSLAPLDDETVQALNPELSLTDLQADLTEIGFPP